MSPLNECLRKRNMGRISSWFSRDIKINRKALDAHAREQVQLLAQFAVHRSPADVLTKTKASPNWHMCSSLARFLSDAAQNPGKTLDLGRRVVHVKRSSGSLLDAKPLEQLHRCAIARSGRA